MDYALAERNRATTPFTSHFGQRFFLKNVLVAGGAMLCSVSVRMPYDENGAFLVERPLARETHTGTVLFAPIAAPIEFIGMVATQ